MQSEHYGSAHAAGLPAFLRYRPAEKESEGKDAEGEEAAHRQLPRMVPRISMG